MYAIKDQFEILVIVSVNIINRDVGEYFDYENCTFRKKLVDRLMKEWTENVDEIKIPGIALFEHGNERVCSYTICVVSALELVAIFFIFIST